MRFVCGILFLLFSLSTLAQDINYAREVVNKLASAEFKGRGYVGDGDSKAADYIKGQFEEIGIAAVGTDYFQRFNLSVNTFPNPLELRIDNQSLKEGVDYLIDASSPSIKGTYETVWLSANDILDQGKFRRKLISSKGKFITIASYETKDYTKEEQSQLSDAINLIKYHPEIPSVGTIVLTNTKLTWSGSTVVSAKPSFTVKAKDTEQFGEVKVNVKNKYYKKYESQNVIGMIEGERSDSTIVFIAHYDHLGMMGDAVFPGANDNASGIGMLLSLAKHYKTNKPIWNTVFIAFGGEELGLLGAKHFVENPLIELSRIKFLVNFDISGTGDDGIQVVNGSVYKKQFEQLKSINDEHQLLKQVKTRGKACNSDHCMFDQHNVPCFFIYTLGGIQSYHDVNDKAETLPLTEFEDYFKLLTAFINLQ